jgi:hypothetical protein
MGGNARMTADRKIVGMSRNALFALMGASALLVGCTSQEDEALQPGTYAITGVDLGSCATETWTKSSTPATSIVVEANGDAFTLKACTDAGCSPTAPSNYAWDADAWTGADGGAYLQESGCLLMYVAATAGIDRDGALVIESTRWVSSLAGGTCTFDEVLAMASGPCEARTRLTAIEQ